MKKGKIPLYQEIYTSLLNDIRTGRYQAGQQLPTEQELAELFQVSKITSRRALDLLVDEGCITRISGKGSFVIAPDSEVGTRLDAGGGKPAKGMLFGVVVEDFADSYGVEMLKSVECEAAGCEVAVSVTRSHGRQDVEEAAIQRMLRAGVSGIILLPVHGESYNPIVLKLVLEGFPLVMVDRNLKGLSAPFVGTDNVAAAKMATDYLIGEGHRSICFMSPPLENTSTIEQRLEGFINSHAENGVPIDRSLWLTSLTSTIPGKNTREQIQQDIVLIEEHVGTHPDISCIFAVEYNIALIAREAINSLGKRIPEDLSVLCFDAPLDFLGRTSFTHVLQREKDMGSVAVQLLMKLIRGEETQQKVFLEAELVIRDTVRRVR